MVWLGFLSEGEVTGNVVRVTGMAIGGPGPQLAEPITSIATHSGEIRDIVGLRLKLQPSHPGDANNNVAARFQTLNEDRVGGATTWGSHQRPVSGEYVWLENTKAWFFKPSGTNKYLMIVKTNPWKTQEAGVTTLHSKAMGDANGFDNFMLSYVQPSGHWHSLGEYGGGEGKYYEGDIWARTIIVNYQSGLSNRVAEYFDSQQWSQEQKDEAKAQLGSGRQLARGEEADFVRNVNRYVDSINAIPDTIRDDPNLEDPSKATLISDFQNGRLTASQLPHRIEIEDYKEAVRSSALSAHEKQTMITQLEGATPSEMRGLRVALSGQGIQRAPAPVIPSHGACFLAQTPISTPTTITGAATKNIEDIQPGDEVLSYDPENNKVVKSTVVNTFSHEENDFIIVNNKIKVTPYHKVLAKVR